jgi:hypothetical protein
VQDAGPDDDRIGQGRAGGDAQAERVGGFAAARRDDREGAGACRCRQRGKEDAALRVLRSESVAT